MIQTSAHKAKALLLVLFCCMVQQAECQKGPYYITHINKTNGLSNNLCKSVLKDSKGYVWIATENGLNRYDGHNFEVFRHIPGDSTSITGNTIYRLYEDSHHQLWIGGNDFVSRYNLDTHKFFNYNLDKRPEQTLHKTFVESFFEDQQNQLWLCTAGAGFCRYDAQNNLFEHFYPDASKSSGAKNKVTDIAQDQAGQYWLTTQYGLCSFDLQTNTFTWHRTEAPEEKHQGFYNLSTAILIDPKHDDLIWYGTWGTGLHCYNRKTNETTTYLFREALDMNLSNIVFDIAQKDEHTFLLASESGLREFDLRTKHFELTKHDPNNPHSLADDEVKQVSIDDDGIIWLPGNVGVDMIDPHLQYFQLHSVSSDTYLNHVVCDTISHTFYGVNAYSNRRLHIIQQNTWERQTIPLPGADKNITEPFGLFLTRKKELFIGLVRSNILQYVPSTQGFVEIPVSEKTGVPENKIDIRSFAEDGNGNIWMANDFGTVIFWNRENNTFKNYDPELLGYTEFASHECLKVFMHDNTIWAIYNGVGLMQIDIASEVSQACIFPKEGPSSQLRTFSDINIDAEGKFWMTTLSHGLLQVEIQNNSAKILHEINTSMGFPDDNLYFISKVSDGSLWLSGSNGLIQFSPETNSWQAFDETDGLYPYSSDIKVIEIGNGQLAFPVMYYLTSFGQHPTQKQTRQYNIALNSFQVFDKELFESSELSTIQQIELNPDQDYISFEFSALCFSQADRLSYAYILEGFDRDWHYVENRRFGSYTDLPPGEYTLRVTYKSPEGEWSNQPLSIKIIRQPHWYQTIWFKLIFLLCLIAAVLLAIQIYTRTKLRKLERELEKQRSIQNMRSRISRDIHDEIGAGLTKISLMSRRFERDENLSDSTKTIASNISNASKNLVQNLGEIVWTINPKNDTLADLIGYIRSYTSSLFENTTIELTLILPEFSEQTSTLLLQPELKRNVILILKESLNNAIKYSEATHILIEVIHEENALTLKIEDNGQGFDPQAFATKGNGLRNMEKRADEINARFVIESSADHGCKTTLHTALK